MSQTRDDAPEADATGSASDGDAAAAAAQVDAPDDATLTGELEAVVNTADERAAGTDDVTAEADRADDEHRVRAVLERLKGVLSRGADEAAQQTEERYARAQADRLSDPMVAEYAARTTNAREAAFFDLDKTIIARSSTLVMGRTFFRDGLISPSNVVRGLYAQFVYQLVGADHAKMEQMRAALLDLTKGWDADRVSSLASETVEELIAPLVYQEALDLFEEHRNAGRDIWIISSSGEEIVRPFSRHLGIDNFIATRAGVDRSGRYDGTLEFYAYGKAKANAIRQLAEVRGYDLEASYAYSDSITDLSMLGVVGNPTAVNPDRELRAAATAMEWDVRDFVSPVSVRDRLPDVPRPSNRLLLGGLVAAAVGLLAWRLLVDDGPI